MRRARIKALATVPVRRKVVPDAIASTDTSSDVLHEECAKDVVSIGDTLGKDVSEDATKVQEETAEKKQNEISSSEPDIVNKPVIIKKQDPQRPCTQINKNNEPEEVNDELTHKSVPSLETSAIINIGKVYINK